MLDEAWQIEAGEKENICLFKTYRETFLLIFL